MILSLLQFRDLQQATWEIGGDVSEKGLKCQMKRKLEKFLEKGWGKGNKGWEKKNKKKVGVDRTMHVTVLMQISSWWWLSTLSMEHYWDDEKGNKLYGSPKIL